MSILSSTAIIGGVNVLQTALFRQGRSIAGMIPNVVVDETHSDDLTITNHPVEQGASITDHAFKNPAQVTVRYGFADSGLSFIGAGGEPRAVYEQLLQIQASRVPFDLVTGKRQYRNMLIQSLTTTTDQGTENVLVVTAVLKEIIIVNTETVTLGPAQVHAMPEKTAPTENTGTKQLRLDTGSYFYRIKNGAIQIINQ
jgi:hypothetical protein